MGHPLRCLNDIFDLQITAIQGGPPSRFAPPPSVRISYGLHGGDDKTGGSIEESTLVSWHTHEMTFIKVLLKHTHYIHC